MEKFNTLDNLNNFVDNKINPIKVDHDQSLLAQHYLDWMMQSSKDNMIFRSWPDGKFHKFKDGLNHCFNIHDAQYYATQKIIETYNEEIYRLGNKIMKLESQLSKMKDTISLDKLDRIRKILDE